MKKARPASKIGRKRRTLGWTLLTLGLLVAGVWVWSRWWEFSSTDVFSFDLRRGCLGITYSQNLRRGSPIVFESRGVREFVLGNRAFPLGVWSVRGTEGGLDYRVRSNFERINGAWHRYLSNAQHDGVDWGVVYLLRTAEGTRLRIALWPIPLLLWTPAALLLRSGILARRRAVKGLCAKCGYSLAGLAADAPCPECGKGAA